MKIQGPDSALIDTLAALFWLINTFDAGMISGEQVKAARKLIGWSQKKLAIVANISPGDI